MNTKVELVKFHSMIFLSLSSFNKDLSWCLMELFQLIRRTYIV